MITSKLFRLTILVPFLFWIYLGATSQLGADPVKSLNHKSGEISVYLLLFNLLLGVLISFRFKLPKQLKFIYSERRYIGVINFLYLMIHAVFYLFLENFEKKAFEQFFTKKYLMFAGVSFLMMFILFITSNQFSQKKLGFKKWKNIHRLVYLILITSMLHTLLIEKADLIKYGILFGIIIIFEMIRFFLKKRQLFDSVKSI